MLKKPKCLKRGDTVAIVSPSKGTLGEKWAIHKLEIAKKRLEEDYGLKVIVMPNALKGIDYLYDHPELRAKDLMDAFKDPNIKAIFSAIGGDDSIRLLPYIDFDVVRNNPKIFTGFSDITSIHFMLHKAGIVTYYGCSVMTNLAEYVKINDYTARKINDILFEPKDKLEIESSSYYCDDEDEKVWWKIENINKAHPYHKEEVGYEIIQGSKTVEGELLGGCVDVFVEIIGTSIWPSKEEWKNKILFLETSEEDVPADHLIWILRNLGTQGIFDVIKGIIVGKPARRSRSLSYKEAYKQVVSKEFNHPEIPILFNVNFGHAEPIGILPIGIRAKIDCENKKLILLEEATSK